MEEESIESKHCTSEEFIKLRPRERLNISSPGFEDFHYPANAVCTWTVESESGHNSVNI